MYRIFLNHVAPKNKTLEYKLSVAATNFCYNLMDADLFDKVYSILPPFKFNKIERYDGLIYSSLRSVNFLRSLAPIIENITLFFKIPKHSTIWYYNCTLLNAVLIILLKLFKPSVQQNLIILDFTPSSNIKDVLLLKLMNSMDGTIRLANSELFKRTNSTCLPGVVPNKQVNYPLVTSLSFDFLISGFLGENISMISVLLKVFSQRPNLRLHITGKSTNTQEIEKYASKYHNIIYHGMVEYAEYLSILHSCPFLLSTRNPQYIENQCNFPSKIIEALLHNRIIISTIEYEQLKGIKYLKVSSDENSLGCDIDQICQQSSNNLLEYSNQADKVHQMFSTDVWRDAMKSIESHYQ